MTTPVADPVVMPLAEALVECLDQQVQKVTNPPKTVTLRPGDQVELLIAQGRDECCEGLAWVRVAGFYPSRSFPDPDESPVNCDVTQWAVQLEMGVARCAPTATANDIPTAAQWTATVQAVMDDAAAMRRALLCFAEDMQDVLWLAGEWVPLTVEGGCVGGTMLVTVAAPACDTLEEE